MTLKDQLDALLDATAFDSTGTKIGAVRQVYVDDATGKITFATVATGIFSADAILPLHGARLLDGELHVDHTRSIVRDSPRPDHTEDGLTPEQELRLLEHYGIEAPAQERDGQTSGAPGAPQGSEKTPRQSTNTAADPPAVSGVPNTTTTAPTSDVTPAPTPAGGRTTTSSSPSREESEKPQADAPKGTRADRS